VVCDVATRRVAHDEDACKVGHVGEPGPRGRRRRRSAARTWPWRLRPVEAPGVEVRPPPGPDAEAAAVEVGQHGDPCIVGRA
jgi:hypothetical protein